MAEQREQIEAAKAQAPPAARVQGRGETYKERVDRNFAEILAELRVALPGVQVLFAFLLVAPFNQRFNQVSQFERRLYFATLMCTLFASILLIAPGLVHRLTFRLGEKAYVVDTANRPTIAGLSLLALAMTCAELLITHYPFGAATATITTAAVVLAFAVIWFALPLHHRRAATRRAAGRR